MLVVVANVIREDDGYVIVTEDYDDILFGAPESVPLQHAISIDNYSMKKLTRHFGFDNPEGLKGKTAFLSCNTETLAFFTSVPCNVIKTEDIRKNDK